MANRAVVLLLCSVTLTQAINILRDKSGVPALEVQINKDGVQRYRDKYTGATDYLTLWEPQLTGGFQMIGQRAQARLPWEEMEKLNKGSIFIITGHNLPSKPDWHYMTDGIPTVKDITGNGRSTILVDPVGLQEVWRDEGGTGKMDAAFWRIMCPAGYHALSDIVYACSWCGWPRPEAYKARMRCVHEDFVEICSTTWLPLWTNQGGFANREGSVWGVLPKDGMKHTGFWFGNMGHLTAPKDGDVRCLKQYETIED